MINVEANNQHSTFRVEIERLREAAKAVLVGEGFDSAQVSLAIVDDETIHRLNRQYLQHDYPTDVLSFVLESSDDYLEGEVIVSADTASRVGAEYGLSAADELLLYVIHGVLHLAGHDDHAEQDRQKMRDREQTYLHQFGVSTTNHANRNE